MATLSASLSGRTWRARLIEGWAWINQPFFYVLLTVWAIVCLAPLYFTLVFSLKPVADAYTPPLWWPAPFTLENYKTVLQSTALFPLWVLNSLIVSIATT